MEGFNKVGDDRRGLESKDGHSSISSKTRVSSGAIFLHLYIRQAFLAVAFGLALVFSTSYLKCDNLKMRGSLHKLF